MKELFDQLRTEVERCPLPQPAQLRIRGDRRAAGRGAAGVLTTALLVAAGYVATEPGWQSTVSGLSSTIIRVEATPSHTPAPRAVPNVVGLTKEKAESVLAEHGFKVVVQPGSTIDTHDPKSGTVEQQDPSPQMRSLGQTVITIWVSNFHLAPENCADPYPRKLADKLFSAIGNEVCFQPKARNGNRLMFSESVPAPCAPTPLESDALIEDRRGFRIDASEDINGTQAPTQIHETVTKYRDAGAVNYLMELRTSLTKCGPVSPPELQLTYRLAGQQTPVIGERSLVIEVEYRRITKLEGMPQTSKFLIFAAQVGPYVAVVYDHGWEGAPSKRATLVGLCQALANRLISSPAPAR